MATILFGWELGAGLGHIRALLPIAERMAALGHRCVLATKNVIEPWALLKDKPVEVMQAPMWQSASGSPSGFRAATFADVLAIRGFRNREELTPLVAAWDQLLNTIDAKLVVTDHSPILNLAAYGTVPNILLGNGFTLPPVDGATYPLLDGIGTPLCPQEEILKTVEQVQTELGKPAPKQITDIVRGSERFIRTFPALDPYRRMRQEKLVGPFQSLPTRSDPPSTHFYYVYMATDYTGADMVLPGLAKMGLNGSAFIRGASPELRQKLRSQGFTIYDTPPSLDEVLRQARVILHHGGIGTSESALRAGRPQLLFPRHREQYLVAKALEDQGVAKFFEKAVSLEDVGRALHELLTVERYMEQAQKLARMVESHDPEQTLDAIVNRCVSLL